MQVVINFCGFPLTDDLPKAEGAKLLKILPRLPSFCQQRMLFHIDDPPEDSGGCIPGTQTSAESQEKER